CIQTIILEDKTAPIVITQNITVQLDANGQATITAADINNGSTDNCSIPADGYSLNKTKFDCSNVGANTVTLTVKDVNGNEENAEATVTVVDNIKPTVKTQPVTVYLDADGNASVTVTEVDNGSSDNCGIAERTLNITSFTCANVGANTVTLTVKDVNGNEENAVAKVTEVDNVKPTVKTQPVTVYLDADGNASVT